jgi:CheY-like chemotaxis protein
LVVEDNEISRDLLIKLLRQVGFDTRGVINGREAVEVFEQWQPHLIWMDIRMPVMDGYEATRRIKEKLNGEKKTAIIALTASAFEEDRTKVLETGCDDFVRKPFKECEIFEKMNEYLDVRFLYEAIQPATVKNKKTQHIELTPELLWQLPEDLRLKLKNAVDAVDFDETVGIIEKLHAQNASIADALNDLAIKYKFDKLQELLG